MYKRIYQFSAHSCEWLTQGGDITDATPTVAKYEQKRILGGKGSALVDMCSMGLPVPPGFTITTEVCNEWRKIDGGSTSDHYSAEQDEFVSALMKEVVTHYADLSEHFNDPPLVSVRSGAPISMPGMMDTILNVGLTTETLPMWESLIGERAALDSYRRLIQMMGSTAYGVDHKLFDNELDKWKTKAGVTEDKALECNYLQEVISGYKDIFEAETSKPFPDTMEDQLLAAVMAVFDSWDNERAIYYREANNIDGAMGTAVNVQAMVFGNMGETSGSGVLFTRNPSNGENVIMAEYLPDAQGEDVVAGVRTPEALVLDKDNYGEPDGWRDELIIVCDRLETLYEDMVDVEFTVQNEKLFILQSRAGKRSARAAFKIAYDLVEEGVIDRDTAVSRISLNQYKVARLPGIDPSFKEEPHLTGLPACPGVVTGKPVFSSQEAVDCDEPCILITHETTPDDIKGMAKAAGILTQTGGATSHAAVVARAMDTPCIVGCTDLEIQGSLIGVDGVMFAHSGLEGFKITIDGSTGRVWVGTDVPLVDSSDAPELQAFMTWCMDMQGYCEATTLNPDDDEQEAQIGVAEWWGDVDLLGVVLDELEELPDRSHLTLDIRSPIDLSETCDIGLMGCFGPPPPEETAFEWAVYEELTKRAKSLQGLRILHPEPNKPEAQKLREAGYDIPKSPETVNDLFQDISTTPSQEFIDKVVGGASAWLKLKTLLNQGGFGLKSPKEAAPADYVVFRQLKGM